MEDEVTSIEIERAERSQVDTAGVIEFDNEAGEKGRVFEDEREQGGGARSERPSRNESMRDLHERDSKWPSWDW